MKNLQDREVVQHRVLLATQAVAVAPGLAFGYDAGVQISGMWLGLAMAANAAVFAAFCVSLLADAVFRRHAVARGRH